MLDHAQPHGQAGARGDRDEDAAVLDKRLQVGQPLEAQAAADIVRVVDSAQVRGQLAGLERDRAAEIRAVVEQALADAVDQRRQTRRDGRKDDHVIFRLQVGRGADFLVGNVRVRHLAFVEGQAKPAVVLGVDPGVEQGDPRHGDRVALHVDLAADGVCPQPERFRRRLELARGGRRGFPAHGIRNEPALNFMPSTSNGSSAAKTLTSFSRKRSVASAGSAVALSTNQAEPLPVDAAGRRGPRRRSSVIGASRIDGSTTRKRGDVPQWAEGPAGVVVGARVGGRVILGVEHHVDHPAVGLIHPHHVAARGDFLRLRLLRVGLWFGSGIRPTSRRPAGRERARAWRS